jgi:hypothetical protein
VAAQPDLLAAHGPENSGSEGFAQKAELDEIYVSRDGHLKRAELGIARTDAVLARVQERSLARFRSQALLPGELASHNMAGTTGMS